MYDKFILKYVNQEFETGVYTELHHIVPKHMGGIMIHLILLD